MYICFTFTLGGRSCYFLVRESQCECFVGRYAKCDLLYTTCVPKMLCYQSSRNLISCCIKTSVWTQCWAFSDGLYRYKNRWLLCGCTVSCHTTRSRWELLYWKTKSFIMVAEISFFFFGGGGNLFLGCLICVLWQFRHYFIHFHCDVPQNLTLYSLQTLRYHIPFSNIYTYNVHSKPSTPRVMPLRSLHQVPLCFMWDCVQPSDTTTAGKLKSTVIDDHQFNTGHKWPSIINGRLLTTLVRFGDSRVTSFSARSCLFYQVRSVKVQFY